MIDTKVQKGILSILMERIKSNNYNKIIIKLKNYHGLLFDLQENGLNKVYNPQKLEYHVNNFNFNFKEIRLALDQIIDDIGSIGLTVFSQAYYNMLQIMTIIHDNINLRIKLNSSIEYATYQKFKNTEGYCVYCKENYQARNIRNIKSCLGMIYPSDSQEYEISGNVHDKQDSELREKEQFITMIDNILDKRNNIKNIRINNRYYKELVEYLTQLNRGEDTSEDIKPVGKKSQKSKDSKFVHMMNQQNEAVKYQIVIDEIKGMLAHHYNNNYPTKIKNMFDKFQFLLRDQTTKVIQQKRFINIKDSSVQTDYQSQEEAQIKMAKLQIHHKQKELVALKAVRKDIQEKYMKVLQSERKIHHHNSSLILKCSHYENSIAEKDKTIRFLKTQLKNVYQQFKKQHYDIFQEQLKREISYPISKKYIRDIKISEEERSTLFKRDQQTQVSFIQNELQAHSLKKNKQQGNMSVDIERYFNRSTSRKTIPLSSTTHPLLSLHSRVIQITTNGIINEHLDNHRSDQLGKTIKYSEQKKTKLKGQYKSHKTSKIKPQINKLNRPHKMQRMRTSEQTHLIEHSNATFQYENNKTFSSTFKQPQSPPNFIGSAQKRKQRRPSKMSVMKLQQIDEWDSKITFIKQDFNKEHDNSYRQSACLNKEKDIKIRINKVTKRKRDSMNKQKVREIVNMLKMQRQNRLNPTTLRKVTLDLPQPDLYQAPKEKETSLRDQKQSQESNNSITGHQPQNIVKDVEIVVNIPEQIEEIKMLIENEYTYLKAIGFIDYLLKSFLNKGFNNVNRSLIKYKFQFTKILEKDVDLFGGLQLMVKFSQKTGIWNRYNDHNNQLYISTKYQNFAHKIAKYFGLLKKINAQYFEEYLSFLKDPYTFSLAHFSGQIVDQITYFLKSTGKEGQMEFGATQKHVPLEVNLQNLFMRIIRFHYEIHKSCNHLTQFLQKVGFYRYAI